MTDDKLREALIRIECIASNGVSVPNREVNAEALWKVISEARGALADSATKEGVPDKSESPGLGGIEESRDSASPTTADDEPPPSDAAQQFVFHARVALGIWLDGDEKKKVFEEAMEALDDASVKLEKADESAPKKEETTNVC